MTKLTKTERAKLEIEYRECCEDWRSRDKYVLDKLGVAGMLYIYLGLSLGTTKPEMHLLRLCLLLIGILFAVTLFISVAKDIYYREGAERLLRRLSAQLSINKSLQTLESLKNFDDGLNIQELQFPRKISIQRDKSSLVIPELLRNWLLDRGTFRWIVAFHIASILIFMALFVIILVNWLCGLNLPI